MRQSKFIKRKTTYKEKGERDTEGKKKKMNESRFLENEKTMMFVEVKEKK